VAGVLAALGGLLAVARGVGGVGLARQLPRGYTQVYTLVVQPTDAGNGEGSLLVFAGITPRAHLVWRGISSTKSSSCTASFALTPSPSSSAPSTTHQPASLATLSC